MKILTPLQRQKFASTLACGIILLAALATGADGMELKVETDKLFLADSMLVTPEPNQLNAVHQIFTMPGQLLLGIPLQYTIVWDETTDKIKIPAEEIYLVDEKGGKSPALGDMFYFSGLKTMFSGLSDSRPSNWKEKESRPKKLYPVFAVSTPGSNYTLVIGPSKVPVTVPNKAGELGPSLIATYKVEGASMVDQLNSKLQINKTDHMTTFSPISGTFLGVQLVIEPTPPTRFESEHFYWNTSWFAVVDERGNFSPIAGEIFVDKLGDYVSHNLSKNKSGWGAKPVTLYFAVNKGAKKFTLYCLGKPVTELSVP